MVSDAMRSKDHKAVQLVVPEMRVTTKRWARVERTGPIDTRRRQGSHDLRFGVPVEARVNQEARQAHDARPPLPLR